MCHRENIRPRAKIARANERNLRERKRESAERMIALGNIPGLSLNNALPSSRVTGLPCFSPQKPRKKKFSSWIPPPLLPSLFLFSLVFSSLFPRGNLSHVLRPITDLFGRTDIGWRGKEKSKASGKKRREQETPERNRKENKVVEPSGRIISHLNHAWRWRKAVLFHRHVLWGWREGGWDESGAARNEVLPHRGYHRLSPVPFSHPEQERSLSLMASQYGK